MPAISAGAIWRVRIGGSNTLCSGLFDPTVSGAGTDYTEQDAAQLALTDLASSTPYTTITSTTGGFTAAMVGNGIYIASGTGFTAGRYVITAYTNTNTVTVHTACAASAASGGVAKVGGALAGFEVITTSAPYSSVAGNTVYIRGQGSNDPVDIDYTPALLGINVGNGLRYIGYNGRPKIGHNGRLWYFSAAIGVMTVENFYFVQTASTNLDVGVFYMPGVSSHVAYNCVFDQCGFDSRQMMNGHAYRCSFINTGSQTVGTRPAFAQDSTTGRYSTIRDCLFKDLKYTAIAVASMQVNIIGNIIQNCSGDGITLTSENYLQSFGGILNNTIYDCAGHGISMISTKNNIIQNNIIANITGSGKYGVYVSGAELSAAGANSAIHLAGNNFYGNTSNCNVPISTTNTTLDPQFANAPVDLTPTNTALRVIGGVGAL